MSAEELREAVASATEAPAGNGACDAAPDWRSEVARLAALPPIEADREMEVVAGKLDCLISTLRDEVRRKRGEVAGSAGEASGRALDLTSPEPWPEPVGGAQLLSDLVKVFDRYLALPEHGAVKLALWTVHAHAFEASFVTPRLAITSPQKGCGKTTVLDLLSGLVPKPLQAANVTAAAVFRTIEAKRPTLLVDEADTFLAENEELRGVLNSGHTRNGAVIRVVEHEGDFEPRQFSTWAPVAIAKIGKLPGTLEDRSIKLEMRRASPGEVKERLRRDRLDQFQDLARRCARWAGDNMARLAKADPTMPPSVANRLADNWRPLLAIADCAGGEWPQKVREALAVEAAGASDSALAVMLLADLRELFGADGQGTAKEKLSSSFIVAELEKLEHRPWPEISRGKPITTTKLAAILAPFGIAPKHEMGGNFYLRKGFADAFTRYLPVADGCQPFIPSWAAKNKGLAEQQPFIGVEPDEGLGEPESRAISRAHEGMKGCDSGSGSPPPWSDVDAWRMRLSRAADIEAKRRVTLAWAKAAGGTVNGHGLVLPPDLRPALAELRSAAERLGLKVGAATPGQESFTPTAEWQEIPKGAVLPPGLEFRVDMAGGPTFARLKPDEGEDVW